MMQLMFHLINHNLAVILLVEFLLALGILFGAMILNLDKQELCLIVPMASGKLDNTLLQA